jgi:glyoxylase-like metal-dependent hydrolase (beta-lactamase superfamily II)
MDELVLKTFVLGELYTNCYLIFSKESKRGFLIDAPAPLDEVDEFIRAQGIEVLFVALTHAHFDHIRGLQSIRIPFYVHRADVSLLRDPSLNGSAIFGSSVIIKEVPRIYKEDEPLSFQGRSIRLIHTPGHTPGSVSLQLNGWLFSGDTLFFDSIGRTDIPLASGDTIIASIREKLFALGSDIAVYPGHGPQTTIGREKKHNQFL